MRYDAKTYRLVEPGSLGKRALMVGVAGLALSGVGWALDADRFFHAYLAALVCWLAIALGALFFVMVHYLVSARWSVVLLRLSENVALSIPYLAVLFIPVLFGLGHLYHWSHADVVAADEMLQNKSGYLNAPFFIVRTVIYFAIWSFLAGYLNRMSVKQDAGYDQARTDRVKWVAAVGMIAYALSVTAASFDWLMSLDAHWYSTIFGVNYFAAGLLTFVSVLVLLAIVLRRNGVLTETITVEHYHDLGKLIFAFTIFWSYTNFSQYLLIWYGNIPEETIWYADRWVGSWKTISLIIIFGHFAVPFIVLMTRSAKRSLTVLGVTAAWMVLMHYIEMYWLVYPTYIEHGASFGWMEPVTFVGIGAIVFWVFWSKCAKERLVPINDPKLQGSIDHVNPF
ncbi:hypothetical protein C3F09_04955 [candidate division GN15 bacterium]|uniref:Quinol:cytochrome C oxidoreductase n=1 Tax=candidate division GN15 bacterium TaxID=2072418 RepID=A0A855X243_9BACT|nr:MAG: hypothetical protein C3F09_04955 [candidate division GN15 bacterium]